MMIQETDQFSEEEEAAEEEEEMEVLSVVLFPRNQISNWLIFLLKF